jgi:hypothetical protein
MDAPGVNRDSRSSGRGIESSLRAEFDGGQRHPLGVEARAAPQVPEAAFGRARRRTGADKAGDERAALAAWPIGLVNGLPLIRR